MAVAVARNIQRTVMFDRDRLDAVEEAARGLGLGFSAAIMRLIDLHAGVLLEHVASRPLERFAAERSRSRRLTGELVGDVSTLVREGMTKADAYRRLGVTEAAALRWEKQGREDRDNDRGGLHADLVTALEQARAEFNHELIQEARRKGDYKTLLKLLDPEQFNPVTRSTVDVSVKFAPLVDWEAMPMAKARLLVELLREFSPGIEDPSVSRTARPAIEAVPADVLELVEGEDFTEAPVLEAPALGEQKPEH